MRGSEMSNYKMTFGMACSALGLEAAEIRNFLSFEKFEAVELPWEMICTPDRSLLKEAVRKHKTILCGGISDTNLTGAIPFADEKIRRSFTEELRKALELLASREVRTAALEIPLDQVIGNEDAGKAVREILLGIAQILLKEDMTLLLPLVLPGQPHPDAVARFMRKTLLPNVKLRLDVHPWMIKPDTVLKTLAGTLAFETRALTFRYDADCGSRILEAQVRQWIDYLAPSGFSGPMLLCPFSQNNRMALSEGTNYSDIAEDLQKA